MATPPEGPRDRHCGRQNNKQESEILIVIRMSARARTLQSCVCALRRWLPALVVALTAVVVRPVMAAADFDCVIQPRQVLEIRSPIEGLIERISVDRGDRVQKGQEIALVDTSVERALAQGAKFRAEMDGAIRASQSKLHLTKRKFARTRELTKQDFLPAQQQDEALNERLTAEAELIAAEDNRKLAEIEYQRQLAIIRLKTIKSPINGVVMERILHPGELAESGAGRRPMLRLAQTDVLNVEALLPADAYRQVKLGMAARVTPAIQGSATSTAKVAVIDRVLDPASGTFGIRLELQNPTGEILAGVRCKVAFEALGAPPAAAPAPAKAEPAPAAPRRTSAVVPVPAKALTASR